MLALLLACGEPAEVLPPPPPPDPHAELQGTWTLDDPRLDASWSFADPVVTLTLHGEVTEGSYSVAVVDDATLALTLDDGPVTATVHGDALTLERDGRTWQLSRSASTDRAPSPPP